MASAREMCLHSKRVPELHIAIVATCILEHFYEHYKEPEAINPNKITNFACNLNFCSAAGI